MDDEGEGGDDEEKAWQGALGAPVDGFKAGVADFAKHHEAEEEEKACEKVFEVTDDAIGFVVLQKEKSDGGDETGGGGNGESAEIFGTVGQLGGEGEGVEAGEAHGTANEVDEADHPSEADREFCKNDFKNEEGGGNAEGDDVGEGIEFATEVAFLATEASEAAVEDVEDEGSEDPEEAGFVGLGPSDIIFGLKKAALNNLEYGHKAAEEISCGHDTGEEVGHSAAGGQGRFGF